MQAFVVFGLGNAWVTLGAFSMRAAALAVTQLLLKA
jgi:hypothetical protein